MESGDLHVIFLYDRNVRYSVNAVIAAVDLLKGIRVHLAKDLEEVVETAYTVRSKGYKCVVAFSLLTTMLVVDDFYVKLKRAVEKLKQFNCINVCGGPHPSGDPLGSLLNFNFDYVVIGEGEESFGELLLAVGGNGDPRSVKGLMYCENGGKVMYTGRRRPIDVDKYDPFPYWRGIFNPIEITRGCPYGCFYCQVSYVHGFNYRHRSTDRIVLYVKEILRRGGKDIRFISPGGLAYGAPDACRNANLDAVEMLLSAIKRVADEYKGRIFLGSFPSEVRPEHVTDDSLRLLKKYVANRVIIMGAQSGSQRILRAINRQHSVGDVLNAVTISAKHGFRPDVDIILGIPGETEEDMQATIDLARKVVELGGKLHLHYYIPLPGTPIGLRPPAPIPHGIRKELARIVGMGKGYGEWLKQERLAWNILELHDKNVIMPRDRS